MAERKINTIPLFKSAIFTGSGTSGTAGPFDMRDYHLNGAALIYTLSPIGVGTCGTLDITYSVCSVYDGTYIVAGTFGTSVGTAGGSDARSVTIIPAPFIKVIAGMGTSGSGSFTAHLHVR